MSADVMSTPEVVTIGALSLLVVKEAFAMVRSSRQRNGQAAPNAASVKPEDALWFRDKQLAIHRDVRAIARKLRVELEDD